VVYEGRFFPQRAAAAFLALATRCAFVIDAARAFPPFNPPFRPSATAAGSFPSAGGAVGSGAGSPLMAWMIPNAVVFGSGNFGLRERFGIP
jgi:hypothetical protein